MNLLFSVGNTVLECGWYNPIN